MANILERYGIKEVADVMFYQINDDGTAGAPVLYLDTLKVSTIEQTAEEATANGGKGNPPLIIWDYGKEITVTLEDALFSAKSMAIMFGNGTVATNMTTLRKTISWTCTSEQTAPPAEFEGPQGKRYKVPVDSQDTSKLDAVTYDATGAPTDSNVVGQIYYTTFEMPISNPGVIEISANSFPGTYYVTGDTFARTGADEFFQFIIPKAKVQSENTITLEAEGDPSVFNMNLRVLRPAGGGAMMKLVKYDMNQISQGA